MSNEKGPQTFMFGWSVQSPVNPLPEFGGEGVHYGREGLVSCGWYLTVYCDRGLAEEVAKETGKAVRPVKVLFDDEEDDEMSDWSGSTR